MSFVPACVIICSGAFRKLGLIWSKISIEDVPEYFRIFTLMYFHPCSYLTREYRVSYDFNVTQVFDSVCQGTGKIGSISAAEVLNVIMRCFRKFMII